MPAHARPWCGRLSILALALALWLPTGPARAQGASTAQPDAVELEVWRAAGRLDTAEAYRAYLAAYPSGFFAGFARLALDKAGAGGVPAATVTAVAPATGALKAYGTDSETNIVPLRVGDTLHGPGVLTVGALGSRRQFVLPQGPWVLLAGFDHKSSNQVPVPLSTLAFGQFDGAQLRSLLVTTLNRRAVAPVGGAGASLVAMGMLPRWTAAEHGAAAAPGDLLRTVATVRALRHCAMARWNDPGEGIGAEPAILKAQLAAALAGLGARNPALVLRSEVHLTDQRLNYLAYTRLDCLPTAAGDRCADSPAEAASAAVAARLAWLKAYTPVVVAGYTRDIEDDDLRPGERRPATKIDLPR
jgi:hypothetical protein